LNFPVRKVVKYPKISIVTPCYNSHGTIRETITSVLAQEYRNLEYIIVDGYSSDKTMEIVNEYRDEISLIISEKDSGMYDAIAKGFDRASGDIFAYLNSDDRYLPGALARVAEFFRTHNEESVIFFEDIVEINGWLSQNRPQPYTVTFNMLANSHILYQDGIFFRSAAYKAVGGIDRNLKLAGDWDLWLRLSRCYRFIKLPGHASCFMIRPNQLSSDMKAYLFEIKSKMKQYKKRYRKDLMFGKVKSPYYFFVNIYHKIYRKLSGFPDVDFTFLSDPVTSISHQNFPLKIKQSLFDQSYPETFLFSSPDTRFGIPELSYLFHHTTAHMVSIDSSPADFDSLYGETYSKHFSKVQKTSLSPHYKRFYGGGWVGKLLINISRNRYIFLPLFFRGVPHKVISSITPFYSKQDGNVDLLDVGCFEGRLLTDLRARTKWNLYGIDINKDAVNIVKSKGFRAWHCDVKNILREIPEGVSFHIIHLGQSIEHFPDPLQILDTLTGLLKPGGILVISSPNLDSKQIQLFGPTWSHWHPPFHQWIFSKKSMQLFAKYTGLHLKRFRTYSYPSWTLLTVLLNRNGFASAVPHDLLQKSIDRRNVNQARSIAAFSALAWDWRGKGDFFYAVLQKL